ncbi:MAG: type I restriction enzyme EcoKI subunit R [Syntrophorhabdus sp. PtaU1.Bin002]|nr:MAG: type I restriction enzyme EcoKI subunit R [Syntrophorhabdus sp. PtaU1.Bin002]
MIPLNEAETRTQLIDQQLIKAGWISTERSIISEYFLFSEFLAAEDPPPYSSDKTGFADYVLLGKDGKPLAVVEAKRTSRDALAGKRQAADYADQIKAKFGFDPFIFLVNGKEIFFWERERYAPRPVSGFFRREDLERLIFLKRYGVSTTTVEINTAIAGRDYQLEAIRRTTEAIEAAHRKFLLVMATGTGKTRVIIALIDLLIRAKRVQRVLFLADRRELVKQAMREFKTYLPAETFGRIEGGDIPEGDRIHFATYPSMMQTYERISPGYYDLIVADESHRSIYNRYKAIFERFDALQLGLTATPTDFIDHNTFKLFECDDGIPTFNYSLEQAINDHYLVNYCVLEAQTNFQIAGIQAGQLPLALQQQITEEGLDPEEINFEGTDIERKVTNTGTNNAIIREFMEKSRKDALGIPSKSIVFAVSHAHASRLYKSFNKLYPDYQRRGFAEIIDSHMERADETLDDFKFKDMPRIAISVDMLDTGIDVPAIQNLVFAKPVFSRVKFWQMIGRGTRLYKDPRSHAEKKDFLIIDCWNNFSYFQLNPEGETDHPTEPLPVRLFRLRLEKWQLIRGRNEDARSVISDMKGMLSGLPQDNINVQPHWEEIANLLQHWPDPDEVTISHLSQTIAPLLRYYWSMPLSEIQFRILVEKIAIAWLLAHHEEIEPLTERVRTHLQALPENIKEIKEVLDKRAWVLSEGFWSHLDIARLDDLQNTFAPLMRFRQPAKREMVELKLPDHMARRRWVIYGPAGEGAFAETYREQVEAHVRRLTDDIPGLSELKRGEPLTEKDIEEIARALNQADLFITEDILREVYQQPAANLPDFIRHILGLAKLPTWEEKIKEAFDRFIAEHGYMSASQINFLRGVRATVLRHAKITYEQLHRPPLSRIGTVEDMFQKAEIEEIIAFANRLIDEAA